MSANRIPPCFIGRASTFPRAFLQWVLLWPIVRWFCHPMTVVGRERVPDGPVVFVANHSSHADTALVLRALPGRARRRTHPAAAEDHFWRKPSVGAFVSLLTGAFPFPRKGSAGLERAEHLLESGRSVLLFPEGTRSVDGVVGDFHCGVGKLARRGFPIIPIGISGARAVLPRDARLPRQGPVAVVIGEPRRFTDESPAGIAKELRDETVSLMESAAQSGGPKAPSTYVRVRRFALSRGALVAVFLWAMTEAVVWPIVPDFVLLPLAIAAPARAVKLVGAALLGTVLGGLVAYAAGGTALGGPLLAHAPLVTDRMIAFAGSSIAESGPSVLLSQPWSGVPYKVFAYQASPEGVGPFMIMSALGRGVRFLVFGLSGAVIGTVARPVWQRAFGPLLALYAAAFALGLWRVVLSWG